MNISNKIMAVFFILFTINGCQIYQVPDTSVYTDIDIYDESPFKDLSIKLVVKYEKTPDSLYCKYPKQDLVELLIKSGLFKNVYNNESPESYDLILNFLVNDDTLVCRFPEATAEMSLMLLTLGIFPFKGHVNYNHAFKFISPITKKESKLLQFTTIRKTYGGSLINVMRLSDSWSGVKPDKSLNVDIFKAYLINNKDIILGLLHES